MKIDRGRVRLTPDHPESIMLKIILIIVTCLLCVSGVLSWLGGEFDSVTITQKNIGPYTAVCRKYQGTYSGFRFLIKNVAEYVRNKTSDSLYRGFAVFYDDPSKKSPDSLRFAAGIILEKKIEVDTPYSSIVIDSVVALVGEFPIRSYFSYVNGFSKFTKELEKYLTQNHIALVKPFLEIYDLKKKRIYYIAPIGDSRPVPSFYEL